MEAFDYKEKLVNLYKVYQVTTTSISWANTSLTLVPKIKTVAHRTSSKLTLLLSWWFLCIYYHTILLYSPVFFALIVWVMSIDSKLSIHLEKSKEDRGIENKLEGIQILFQESSKIIDKFNYHKQNLMDQKIALILSAIVIFPIWQYLVTHLSLNYLLLLLGSIIILETVEDYKKARNIMIAMIIYHPKVQMMIEYVSYKGMKIKQFYETFKEEEFYDINRINKYKDYSSISIPSTPTRRYEHLWLNMSKSTSTPVSINNNKFDSYDSQPLCKHKSLEFENHDVTSYQCESQHLEKILSSSSDYSNNSNHCPLIARPTEVMLPSCDASDTTRYDDDLDATIYKPIALLQTKYQIWEYQRYYGKYGYLSKTLKEDPPLWATIKDEPCEPKNILELPKPVSTMHSKYHTKIQFYWIWYDEWKHRDNATSALEKCDEQGWQYGDIKYGFNSATSDVPYSFGLKKFPLRRRRWQRTATLFKVQC